MIIRFLPNVVMEGFSVYSPFSFFLSLFFFWRAENKGKQEMRGSMRRVRKDGKAVGKEVEDGGSETQ